MSEQNHFAHGLYLSITNSQGLQVIAKNYRLVWLIFFALFWLLICLFFCFLLRLTNKEYETFRFPREKKISVTFLTKTTIILSRLRYLRYFLAQVARPGEEHIQALEMITYLGCGLSLLGEALTIITITTLK